MDKDVAVTTEHLTKALRALDARVTALETRDAEQSEDGKNIDKRDDYGSPFWALDGLKSRIDQRSAVLYTGAASLPDDRYYEWQEAVGLDQLLNGDWDGIDRSLAALGHPVRLNLIRELLMGLTSTSDIQSQEGFGTTGQLYHHLRQLVATGWVRATERGHYEIVPERVIPLLAILAAARPRK